MMTVFIDESGTLPDTKDKFIKHVDSVQNFLVNLADMSAGSVLWKYRGKDSQFYNLIKENIVVEKIISWPEAKKKSL